VLLFHHDALSISIGFGSFTQGSCLRRFVWSRKNLCRRRNGSSMVFKIDSVHSISTNTPRSFYLLLPRLTAAMPVSMPCVCLIWSFVSFPLQRQRSHRRRLREEQSLPCKKPWLRKCRKSKRTWRVSKRNMVRTCTYCIECLAWTQFREGYRLCCWKESVVDMRVARAHMSVIDA
jgi:hypothetical protein